MKVKFIEENVLQEQIDWGSCADPRDILEVGKEYELDYADVHSSHTEVFLKDFPKLSFNSVWFNIDDVMKLTTRSF
jgi:hypothetical protein